MGADLAPSAFTVYPNPAQHEVRLACPGIGAVTVDVLNANGQLLQHPDRFLPEQDAMDLSQLPTGPLFIRIHGEGLRASARVIHLPRSLGSQGPATERTHQLHRLPMALGFPAARPVCIARRTLGSNRRCLMPVPRIGPVPYVSFETTGTPCTEPPPPPAVHISSGIAFRAMDLSARTAERPV